MSGVNQIETYKLQKTTRLVYGGSDYFDLVQDMINRAEKSLHLHVYIYEDDETGTQVAECLMNAAKRGVQVYLLVDGYASKELSGQFIEKLKEAGVHFQQFEPLFRSKKFYFGRRLHHKILVADSSEALVGGINIANKYNSINGTIPWLDMAMYVQGEAAYELESICCETWNSTTGTGKKIKACDAPTGNGQHTIAVRIRRNDWVKGKREIWKSYANLIANTKEELVIMCSYFLPGLTFRKLMTKAVKRGVRITVIVAGKSDVPIAKNAERYLYRWMLRNKIEIYEYEKSILHAKMAISDRRLMTIGSYNMNNISAYASIELNLDIHNKPFVEGVYEKVSQLVTEDCVQVTAEHYQTYYGARKRLWQYISYQVIRAILYLSTFYFKREKLS